jgi:hypothetical protein
MDRQDISVAQPRRDFIDKEAGFRRDQRAWRHDGMDADLADAAPLRQNMH